MRPSVNSVPNFFPRARTKLRVSSTCIGFRARDNEQKEKTMAKLFKGGSR